MSSDRVIYNGIEMAKEWPVRIKDAQKVRDYVIGGKVYSRIPYGTEEGGREFPEPCRDCGVLRGQYHVEGVCDMEECPSCHGQAIGCDCSYEGDDRDDAVELNKAAPGSTSLKWRELLERFESEVSGYTVFLETESGKFLSLASAQPGKASHDVVGQIITYIREGLPPWDTEQPVKQLAQRLSARSHRSC